MEAQADTWRTQEGDRSGLWVETVPKVDPDAPQRNLEGRQGSSFSDRISELENELREEKNISHKLKTELELAKVAASEEIERYRWECSTLKEHVCSLEEECKISQDREKKHKEREKKDKERMKSLSEKLEMKEKDFKVKYFELITENKDLKCAKIRASAEVHEWNKKRKKESRGNFIDVDADDSDLELAKKKLEDEIHEWKMKCRDLEADCSTRKMSVARLEEECGTLRESELRNQERIKSLLVETKTKEREYMDKYVELECAKRRAEDEVVVWMKKCAEEEAHGLKLLEENRCLNERGKVEAENAKGKEFDELETRILKLVEEKIHLIEKGKGVENAKGKAACEIDVEMLKRERRFVVADSNNEDDPNNHDSDDAEDRIPLAKRCVELSKIDGKRLRAYQKETCCKKTYRKRICKSQMSRRTYTGQIASSKQRHRKSHQRAVQRAETFQRNMKSGNPSFIKVMLRSHVADRFWIGFPKQFCEENLPAQVLEMTLEDEKGFEYKIKYIGNKVGGRARGEWNHFATDHKLEVGDALIFELSQPTRFKVYIIKDFPEESSEDRDDRFASRHSNGTTEWGETNRIKN